MINKVGAGAALAHTIKKAPTLGAPAHNHEAQGANKGRAIGLEAKALVSQAREAGAELPNNIQGKAASSLARGIDPASLFAAVATAPDVSPLPPSDAPGEQSESEQSPPPEGPAQTLHPETAGLAFLPPDFAQSGEGADLDILLGGNN